MQDGDALQETRITLVAGRLPVAAASTAWSTRTSETLPASERWGVGGGESRGGWRQGEVGTREQGHGSGSWQWVTAVVYDSGAKSARRKNFPLALT